MMVVVVRWKIRNKGGFFVSGSFKTKEGAERSLRTRVKDGAIAENLEVVEVVE